MLSVNYCGWNTAGGAIKLHVYTGQNLQYPPGRTVTTPGRPEMRAHVGQGLAARGTGPTPTVETESAGKASHARQRAVCPFFKE